MLNRLHVQHRVGEQISGCQVLGSREGLTTERSSKQEGFWRGDGSNLHLGCGGSYWTKCTCPNADLYTKKVLLPINYTSVNPTLDASAMLAWKIPHASTSHPACPIIVLIT